MKTLKFALIIFFLPLVAFTTAHKFYVSITKIEYVKDKESVQIISRVFIDDFEKLLRERYDKTITLSIKDEHNLIDFYSERYILDKLKIKINNQDTKLIYLGKEYQDDIVYFYLEIEKVKNINTLEISNKLLFDLTQEQQNIVRTNINSKKKSFIFIKGNSQGLLNFN